jgi:hypothetical protein
MTTNGKLCIILWGMVFMVLFLYVNAFLLVSIKVPDPLEGYSYRNVSPFWTVTSESLQHILLCLTLPAWIVTERIYESYYADLVYYPLLAAIIWFGYGCLISWAYRTRRLSKVSLLLSLLWAVFLYMEWAARHSVPHP